MQKVKHFVEVKKTVQTRHPKNYYIRLFNNLYRGCLRVAEVTEEAGAPTEAPLVAEVEETSHQGTSTSTTTKKK